MILCVHYDSLTNTLYHYRRPFLYQSTLSLAFPVCNRVMILIKYLLRVWAVVGHKKGMMLITIFMTWWSQTESSVVQRLTWIFGDIIVSKNKKEKCTESQRGKRKQRVQHGMT